MVTKDIKANSDSDEAEEKISRFQRGAHQAQPQIMTVNETNRVHYNLTNPRISESFFIRTTRMGSIARIL